MQELLPSGLAKEVQVYVISTIIRVCLVLGLITIIFCQGCSLNQQLAILRKKIDRMENGVSTLVIYDPKTQKNLKYLAIGTASIDVVGEKPGKFLPMFVNQTGYERTEDLARDTLVNYMLRTKQPEGKTK